MSDDRRMDPAILLRAIRRARRLSQRELAEVACLPPSTIDRIESGRTRQPSLQTIETILRATGYQLVIANGLGNPFGLDEENERLYDRGGRHFPAHLDARRLHKIDRWAGWSRKPWYFCDVIPPEWVYDGRLRRQAAFLPWVGDQRWDDAT